MKKIIFSLCFLFLLIVNIKAQSLSEIINDESTLLVDVRTPKEFAEGNVEKSINIPLQSLEENLHLFQNRKHIVIFCRSGNRSAKAIKYLKEKGINNLHDGKTWQNVEKIIQQNLKLNSKKCHKNSKN